MLIYPYSFSWLSEGSRPNVNTIQLKKKKPDSLKKERDKTKGVKKTYFMCPNCTSTRINILYKALNDHMHLQFSIPSLARPHL